MARFVRPQSWAMLVIAPEAATVLPAAYGIKKGPIGPNAPVLTQMAAIRAARDLRRPLRDQYQTADRRCRFCDVRPRLLAFSG